MVMQERREKEHSGDARRWEWEARGAGKDTVEGSEDEVHIATGDGQQTLGGASGQRLGRLPAIWSVFETSP